MENNIEEIKEFLLKAKKQTYANGNVKKVNSSRVGSNDYHYEEEKDGVLMQYHDTYFGGTRFMGEEVVYLNSNVPIWGMNYYGNTLDEMLSEEAVDNALRPALMKVGQDLDILPIRGPKEFVNGDYTYTLKTEGTLEKFTGIEEIHYKEKLVYRLYCHGGLIK